MVTIRRVDVQNMRVQASTGAPIGAESALLQDIKNAIQPSGEDISVIQAITRENAKLINKLVELFRDGPRGGGGGGGGGGDGDGRVHTPGGPREEVAFHGKLLDLNTQIVERLVILEQLLSEGGGVGGEGRSRGGSILDRTAFQFESLSRRYEATDRIYKTIMATNMTASEKFQSVIGNMGKTGGVIHSQYQARQKDAILGLVNLATKTIDLVNIFEKLSGFVRKNIVEGYTGYLQNNRSVGVSGEEYQFDTLYRLFTNGWEKIGYSIGLMSSSVQKIAGSGITSPTILTGQTIGSLSQSMQQLRADMLKNGYNSRQTFSPEGFTNAFSVLAEQMKAVGPFKDMRDADTRISLQKQMMRLDEISRYTGISADKLVEMVKANTQEVSELAAMDAITKEQATRLQEFLLQSKAGYGQQGEFMNSQIKQWLVARQNESTFINNNPNAAVINNASGGAYFDWLKRSTQIALSDATTEQKSRQITALNQELGPQLHNVLGQITQWMSKDIRDLNNQLGVASTSLGNNALQLQKPPQPGWPADLATYFEDLLKQVPLLAGSFHFLGDVIKAAITGLVLFGTKPLIQRLWPTVTEAVAGTVAGAGGGGAGGAGGAAGGGAGGAASGLRMFSRVLPWAGGVLGGIGGAANAYMNDAPATGVIGAGVGGASGTMVGAALGALTSFFTGPFGPIIGGAVGGAVGSWLGEKGGTAISPRSAESQTSQTSGMQVNLGAPAVPVMQNVAGPAAAAAAGPPAPSFSSDFQDQMLVALGRLLDSGGAGNDYLARIQGELVRQTGFLASGGEAGMGGYSDRGLSSQTASVAKTGRPDSSTPYSGPGM